MSTLYEKDVSAWADEQAALLRAGKLADADLENIAEELESMGRSERREVASRLVVLLVHLLKWRYQPDFQTRSWSATIITQRHDIERVLDDNPSIRPRLDEMTGTAYATARLVAASETGMDERTFPKECPWTVDQALYLDWKA